MFLRMSSRKWKEAYLELYVASDDLVVAMAADRGRCHFG